MSPQYFQDLHSKLKICGAQCRRCIEFVKVVINRARLAAIRLSLGEAWNLPNVIVAVAFVIHLETINMPALYDPRILWKQEHSDELFGRDIHYVMHNFKFVSQGIATSCAASLSCSDWCKIHSSPRIYLGATWGKNEISAWLLTYWGTTTESREEIFQCWKL